MKIFKYKLESGITLVDMPKGAEILCAQAQFGEPYIWARVNPDNASVKRRIIIAGTGHSCEDYPYISTIQLDDGYLVLHVFDGGEY